MPKYVNDAFPQAKHRGAEDDLEVKYLILNFNFSNLLFRK
jgi:hypothetical protein